MTRMTMTAGGSTPLPRKTRDRAHPVSDFATRLFDAIGAWSDRSDQRRHLAAASDHLLRDMGLSRLDAESEAEKPFWRQ